MKKIAIHPNRRGIHIPSSIGDSIADGVTNFFGTWLCLGLHVVWFALWFIFALDVALLTNIVSLEAIGLAILIMMSQSRSAARDRARDDIEAVEVANTETTVKAIHELVQEVHKINVQQTEMIELLRPKTRGSKQ